MKKNYKRILNLITALCWALVALAVMFLWNWLIPDITGWKEINYIQAVGLLLLSRLLISSSVVSTIVRENDSKEPLFEDEEDDDLEFDSEEDNSESFEDDKDYKVKVIKRGNLEIKLSRKK